MGKGVAWKETTTDVVLFGDRIRGIYLLDAFLTKTDVEHTQLSCELLVFSKEERQLRLLQGECQVGMNDIGTDIIGIVLSH